LWLNLILDEKRAENLKFFVLFNLPVVTTCLLVPMFPKLAAAMWRLLILLTCCTLLLIQGVMIISNEQRASANIDTRMAVVLAAALRTTLPHQH
jgi:hypothetical protein